MVDRYCTCIFFKLHTVATYVQVSLNMNHDANPMDKDATEILLILRRGIRISKTVLLNNYKATMPKAMTKKTLAPARPHHYSGEP